MLVRTRLVRLLLAVSATVAAGCDGGITTPAEVPDVRPYVTGAAAAALAADGTFAFPAPASPTGRAIVGPERARLLAASYVLSAGTNLVRYWEDDRGRRIDLARLQPNARVFYAATPYAPFPEGYHPAFGHAFGPYYLVRMMEGGTPAVMVAVAAYATQVEIGADGMISRPVQSGSEFLSRGVPVDAGRAVPTPEQAVVRVGRLTGARVQAVPELVVPGWPQGPMEALWKLTLDRTVPVRTKGGRRLDTRHLYTGGGAGRQLMVPATDQPTHLPFLAARVSPTGESLPPEMVNLPILPGAVTVFEEVVVQP